MLSGRGKRKVEGWEEEVEASNGRFVRFKAALRSNDKLWVATFLIIMLAGVGLFVARVRQENQFKVDLPEPVHTETGPYRDSKHSDFVNDFTNRIRIRGVRVSARFANAGAFEIILPSDVNNEDISFFSKTAAYAILRRFKNSPIVYVYTESEDLPKSRLLVATTEWVKRRNGYEVTYHGASLEGQTEEEPTSAEGVTSEEPDNSTVYTPSE